VDWDSKRATFVAEPHAGQGRVRLKVMVDWREFGAKITNYVSE